MKVAPDSEEECVGDNGGWDEVVQKVCEPQLHQGHQLLVPGEIVAGGVGGPVFQGEAGGCGVVKPWSLERLLGEGPKQKPVGWK